jgi:flagellar biosynthesis protein FlhB
MPGEKTEKPTPKKIRDARKKGQVFKSQDLTNAFLFLTAAAVIVFGGSMFTDGLRKLFTEAFQPETFRGFHSADSLVASAGHSFASALIMLLPLLGGLFVVAVMLNFLQVNALFSMEVLSPKLDKLNPVSGFQNMFFKAKTYIELAKNVLKIVVVLTLAYYIVKGSLADLVLVERLSVQSAAKLAGALMAGLLLRIGVAFLVLGAADYFLQKHLYMKNLMMSKQEVIDEYKHEEGDPHIKGARKQLHEQLLAESSTAAVPKADVVVVNPTHLAVAVQYDEHSMHAPMVVAKGQMLRAQKIIDIARASRVPVLRNVPLAHSLFEIDIGHEIPEDLFDAVAEVLNWVYSLVEE